MDVELLYFFNTLAGKSSLFDAVFIFLAAYLQYLLVVVFFLIIYFSAYSRERKLRILWVVSTAGILSRVGITEVIRFFYHRPRPFVMYPLHQLITDTAWSFPSGHSTFFFAAATALYFYNKKWGTAFFIAAVSMSVSRVIAGVHYPSDIIGGMVIGMTVAYGVFRIAERKKLC